VSDAAIDVRRAGPDDAEILSRIGTRSFRNAYEGTASAEDLLSHLDDFCGPEVVRTELNRPGRWYLLASIGGEPAGFVKIRDGESPECVKAGKVLELQQVYVAPDKQRHGLGAHLIDAALNLGGFMGVSGFWLSVWQEAPWAVNAYSKYGFEKVGTAEFRLGSTVHTDWVMYKGL
jgi:ribosomal protein S18 acetylase RimI-like enzyme